MTPDRVFLYPAPASNYVLVRRRSQCRRLCSVERPTYEPLLRIPQAFGQPVRRFERRFGGGYSIDIDAFAKAVTRQTRLAIVTNLHNPSGARIPMQVMKQMARLLARVGAFLLVDEVYLECLFRDDAVSCVHAGANVLVTNSLTKAYGLDGLRAGWILGPRQLIARDGRIHDVMTNNGVARRTDGARCVPSLAAVDARAHARLDRNLGIVRRFLRANAACRSCCRKAATSCSRGCRPA